MQSICSVKQAACLNWLMNDLPVEYLSTEDDLMLMLQHAFPMTQSQFTDSLQQVKSILSLANFETLNFGTFQ